MIYLKKTGKVEYEQSPYTGKVEYEKSLTNLLDQARYVKEWTDHKDNENKKKVCVIGVSPGNKTCYGLDDMGTRFNDDTTAWVFLDHRKASNKNALFLQADFNKLDDLDILKEILSKTFDAIYVDASTSKFLKWDKRHLERMSGLLKDNATLDIPLEITFWYDFNPTPAIKNEILKLRCMENESGIQSFLKKYNDQEYENRQRENNEPFEKLPYHFCLLNCPYLAKKPKTVFLNAMMNRIQNYFQENVPSLSVEGTPHGKLPFPINYETFYDHCLYLKIKKSKENSTELALVEQ